MRPATLTDDIESEQSDGLDVALAARQQIARTEAAQYDALLTYLGQVAAEPLAKAGGLKEWTQYGGSGTPNVSEYAIAEIGPALGLTVNGGRDLVADAVDLAYRLPKLFECLHHGTVDAWRVRNVARKTRRFTIAQAGDADRRLADEGNCGEPLLSRVTMGRVQQILDQIRIVEDPDDPEDQRADARRRRNVSLWPEDGIARISGTLSLEDGKRLDQRLDQLAETMRYLGDKRGYDILRTVALGMLSEPDSLDDLYAQVAATTDPGTTDPSHTGQPEAEAERPESADAADAGAPVAQASTRPRLTRRLRKTVLYVHFDRTWGTWSLEDIGAITRSEALDILGHSQITLKPVIDLDTTISTTGYVAPPRLKEQTALMNAGTCTFPSCHRQARICDYDHIVNHADGGPTDSRNGHRLCRYHHRAKTFTEWTVTSPAPGIWLWLSPDGRSYLVTGGTTTKLPGRVTKPVQDKRKHDAA